MYHCGDCTCGKGGESETACTPAWTVPAEKRMEEKAYVLLRGLYLRKEKGERNRMYRCGDCTCGKGGAVEWACMPAQERNFVCGRRSGN